MNIYPTNVTYEGDIRQYDRGKKNLFTTTSQTFIMDFSHVVKLLIRKRSNDKSSISFRACKRNLFVKINPIAVLC